MKSILPIFFRSHRNTPLYARCKTCVHVRVTHTHVRENSVPACTSASSAPTRILTRQRFRRVHAHACAFPRRRLVLAAGEGIKKHRAVGGDVTTIPLGFALWVSEWKPVSQSGEQARACSVPGALLRAEPLNDTCVIDAWLWIVTIEQVFSLWVDEREGKARNAVVTSNYDSIGDWKRCTAIGLLPARSANSDFYILESNVCCCCVPSFHRIYFGYSVLRIFTASCACYIATPTRLSVPLFHFFPALPVGPRFEARV